jgi:protein-S-isoprenylcysteine O-methyltransferase Ste14
VLWLRSLFFALLLPGSVLVWVPLWLSSYSGGTVDPGVARELGVLLVLAGAAALLWCISDFARRGKGTLAPVDPPQFVVRSGLYQWVRNPMYVAVLTVLAGEVLLFGSLRLLVWAVVVAVTVHLFVVLYEEPTLRRLFGTDFEEYCASVPRWVPRVRR